MPKMRGIPMPKRIVRLVFVTWVLLAIFTSGCIFGGLKKIVSLELSAEKTELLLGDEVELFAVGTTSKGTKVTLIPDWEIVSGSGGIEYNTKKAAFSAVDWDYVGDVTLKATYNGITAELTITIDKLPQAFDPFPTPISPLSFLPNKTESFLVAVGEPIDFLIDIVPIRMVSGSNSKVQGYRLVFVKDGIPQVPTFPTDRGIVFSFYNPYQGTPLPEVPRLSHRVYFERIDSEVLDRGTNYARSVTHRTGTTEEQVNELISHISAELSAKATWGWGEAEAKLTREITTRTQQSLRIEKENSVSKTWSFQHPNDHDVYLYSSWNRVDVFYLSDSNGVPLEESPILKDWGFPSRPVEIRGNGVVQRAWGFNY